MLVDNTFQTIRIMSHIVKMSTYGHGCLNIRGAYTADILRYTSFRASWRKMADSLAFIQIDKLSKFFTDL